MKQRRIWGDPRLVSAACAAIKQPNEFEDRVFKNISHDFAKKFVLFRGTSPDMLAYHRVLVLIRQTQHDLERCSKEGLSICKFSGAYKWLKRAAATYTDLYNGCETSDNVEFDALMYEFFRTGGTL